MTQVDAHIWLVGGECVYWLVGSVFVGGGGGLAIPRLWETPEVKLVLLQRNIHNNKPSLIRMY